MNYDLFIPAAAINSRIDSAVSAGRVVPGRRDQVAPLPGTAGPRFDGEAALRPPRNSASEQLNTEEVANTVDALNEVFEQANVGVRYRIDENTNDLVITLIDRNTEEVLRQIPPDQILHMRQRLEELMGLIFDGTA